MLCGEALARGDEIADAVIEGTAMRKSDDTDMNTATSKDAAYFYDKDAEEEGSDEAYLGASTIAKMRDAKLFEEEKPAEATETPAEGTK